MTSKHKEILPPNYEIDKWPPSWKGGPYFIPASLIFDGGGDMREILLSEWFHFGRIWQLTTLPVGKLSAENQDNLWQCYGLLSSFANDENNKREMPDLAECCKNFSQVIGRLYSKGFVILPPITERDLTQYRRWFKELTILLLSETGKLTTILLEDKQGYAVTALWKHPDRLLPGEIYHCLSDFVKSNLTEAAKCLVLNCYTAVGFHSMRSIEHVSRKFYELLKGKPPIKPNGESMGLGAIAQEMMDLKKQSEDVAIIGGIIKGLTTKKRDPLAHPDIVALKEGEATETFIDALQIISKVVVDAKSKGSYYVTPWAPGFLF